MINLSLKDCLLKAKNLQQFLWQRMPMRDVREKDGTHIQNLLDLRVIRGLGNMQPQMV